MLSLLSRGAWIEMPPHTLTKQLSASLLSRGAWIEISKPTPTPWAKKSLLSRGAWIEINGLNSKSADLYVAPLTRSVD